MNNIILSFIVGLLSITTAQAQTKSPIVMELFTSQSCSSCPPADKILQTLSEENDHIIALSCNVTYWNHLHWEDTLSKDFCTARQRQYMDSLHSRGPYTPQLVINGRYEMVGSKENKIKRTLSEDAPLNQIADIALSLSDKTLEITLPNLSDGAYSLLLFAYGNDHTQKIPSGENRGRTVSYTNPVQDIIDLGQWDGHGKTLTHDISVLANKAGFVVLAQRKSATGKIDAAGKLEN